MKNKYKLYEVEYMKGMMMYKYISETVCDNIIQAEDYFDGQMNTGCQYTITIERQ